MWAHCFEEKKIMARDNECINSVWKNHLVFKHSCEAFVVYCNQGESTGFCFHFKILLYIHHNNIICTWRIVWLMITNNLWTEKNSWITNVYNNIITIVQYILSYTFELLQCKILILLLFYCNCVFACIIH